MSPDLKRYCPSQYSRRVSMQEYREYIRTAILQLQERSPEDAASSIKSLVSRQTGVPENYITVDFAQDEILVSIRPPEPVQLTSIYFSLEGEQ